MLGQKFSITYKGMWPKVLETLEPLELLIARYTHVKLLRAGMVIPCHQEQ